MELKGKSEEERCSYFLLCIGEKGREIYQTLTFATPETEEGKGGTLVWKRTTQQLRNGFTQYCNSRKKITYERHKFNIRDQIENETIDQYVTVQQTLAATCEFESLHDGLIRDRIVCGIKNQSLKERLLRETDLTLTKAIDICRAAEVSREQVKALGDKTPANVDASRKDSQREQHNYNHATRNGIVPETYTRKPVEIAADLTHQNNVLHTVKRATVVVKVGILLSSADLARTG